MPRLTKDNLRISPAAANYFKKLKDNNSKMQTETMNQK